MVNDHLYVIGGQEGDFMPKPGSPIFKCSRRHEVLPSLVISCINEFPVAYCNLDSWIQRYGKWNWTWLSVVTCI